MTDGWGRVHGLPNLHIAGSSLFPTGGWANPTLTILAWRCAPPTGFPASLMAARPGIVARDTGTARSAEVPYAAQSRRASCSAITARVTACIRSCDAPSDLLGTVMIAIA